MAFPTTSVGAYSNGSTDLDAMMPSLWGEKVNDFYRANLVCAPFFTDRSDEVADGGRIIYTPSVTEMAATAKSNATAVTLVAPDETNVTLTIDQWYEVSFAIEDREMAQVKHSYTVQESYARSAGYGVAKKLDTAITSLFSGFSQSVGASTTNLADSEIRAAIAYLDSANVPQEDRAFFMHPDVFWNDVQSLDKFSLAINSPVQDPVAKKPMAYLYGIPVYITTQIQYVSGTTGRYNALAHKDAIHWATSPLGSGGSKGSMVGSAGVRVQSNYIPEYLSTLTTADILYGVIENRDTSGVKMLTAA